MLPAAVVLAVPVLGVVEKAASAVKPVVDLGQTLAPWGGDLTAFMPEHQFFGMTSTSALVLLGPLLLVALALELRRQPRALGIALGGAVLFGIAAALWFRPRDFGWYFHFKALAFVGPLALLIATVGVSRLRRLAWAPLAVLVLLAVQGAKDELAVTYDQTPRAVTELQDVDARLPPGVSVRLDMPANEQLWAAYFLAGQPLCSRTPLLHTSYPHVPISSAADYAVVDHRYVDPPADRAGVELWRGQWYSLYRLRPSAAGADRACSRWMVQTVERVTIT
jgi:hypothetical protein